MAAIEEVFCFRLPSLDLPPVIDLPGGAQLAAVADATRDYGPCALQYNLMTQALPGLAWLAPYMKIIDFLAALQECFNAIAGAATATPPNPGAVFTEMATCFPELASKANDVIAFFNAAAQAAKTIASMLQLMKLQVDCVIGQLNFLNEQIVGAQAILANAANTGANAVQQQLAQCAITNAQTQAVNATMVLVTLGRVTMLLRGLVSLVPGLSDALDSAGLSIPCFDPSTIDGLPLEDVIATLEEFKSLLDQVLALPLLSVVLSDPSVSPCVGA